MNAQTSQNDYNNIKTTKFLNIKLQKHTLQATWILFHPKFVFLSSNQGQEKNQFDEAILYIITKHQHKSYNTSNNKK